MCDGANGEPGQDGRPGEDGTNGVDGENGRYLQQIFKQSDTRPSPPAYPYIPGDWSASPDFPGLTILGYDGDFLSDGNGRRSPKYTENSKAYKDVMRFRTTEDNQYIQIRMSVSSESGYDKFYLGYVDRTVTADNNFKVYSGEDVAIVPVIVESKGEHYIEVMYSKDSSGNAGQDMGRYSIFQSKTVWVTSAQATYDKASHNWIYTGWTQPVKYLADTPDMEYIYRRAGTNFTPPSEEYLDKHIPLPFSPSADYRGLYQNSLAQVTGAIYKNGNGNLFYQCVKYRAANSTIEITNKDYFTFLEPFTDNPLGVSEEYPVEYMSLRHKKDGKWGAFSPPAVHARIGSPGADGSPGAQPRDCGMFKDGVEYVWDNVFRDIVHHQIDGALLAFQIKKMGASVTFPPTSSVGDDNWTVANKYNFAAFDTALIDGADIAGFTYKNLRMISREGRLDGVEIDISDVPSNRFADFIPNIMMDGNTGDAEFNKIKVRGSVSEPFEAYSSVEALRNGISMSWIINNHDTLNNSVLNFSDKRFNGQTLRIYNNSGNVWADMTFFMQITPSGGLSNVSLPTNTLLTAIGVLNPSTGYVSWHLTCPYTRDPSSVIYKIQNYSK